MEIEEIKKKMLEYKDLYGEPLYDVDKVTYAINKGELRRIISDHQAHIKFFNDGAIWHLDKLIENLFIHK